MSDTQSVQAININQLKTQGTYLIPIYQRNYAWGENEIETLINDILDSCKKRTKHYYIGSLVVYCRPDDHRYEVIDGQQRLTSLYILLDALKDNSNIQLEFELRKEDLSCLNSTSDTRTASIQSAYKICKKKLADIVDDTDAFTEYLKTQVIIIHTELPPHTDLNHYFEIMNNRGEQLEKHEVLKAKFMDTLKTREEQDCFAKIWDACSQMDGYVIKSFSADERQALFGKELSDCPATFELVQQGLKKNDDKPTHSNIQDKDKSTNDLNTLLESSPKYPILDREKKAMAEKEYRSIIKFPNFLLHALRIALKNRVTPLDDKQLLDSFFHKHELIVDAKFFAITLLQCRFLFDTYVIKSHSEGRWTLRKIKFYEKNTSIGEVNSFGKEDDELLNRQNIMIQSMFHVSFPTQNYKYWLDGLLTKLYQSNGNDSLAFMERLSDRFFFGRFGLNNEPAKYNEILEKDSYTAEDWNNKNTRSELENKHLHQGTTVHNFIFNRLDYLLWKDKGMKDDFHFTFRSSVEHFYPQNPNSLSKLEKKLLDHFGNLCLISRSSNSKFSNASPTEKNNIATKSLSGLESLKLQCLLKKANDWNKLTDDNKVMYQHAESMVDTLIQTPAQGDLDEPME